MIALGIEAEQKILDVCKNNLLAFNTGRCSVVNENSERFVSFCPARIVVNYDGGIQPMQSNANGKIHRTIMRTAFCSPSGGCSGFHKTQLEYLLDVLFEAS